MLVFGDNLKKYRKEKDLTQAALGKKDKAFGLVLYLSIFSIFPLVVKIWAAIWAAGRPVIIYSFSIRSAIVQCSPAILSVPYSPNKKPGGQ